jgi:hypothetical protein
MLKYELVKYTIVIALYLNLVNSLNEKITDKETDPDPLAYQKEIVNRHDFKYILNPEHQICVKNESIFLLIYVTKNKIIPIFDLNLKANFKVHSAPSNFKRRQALRETWAKRSMIHDLRIVFMMGYSADYKVIKVFSSLN